MVDSSLLCPQGDCHVAETIRQQKADFYALTGVPAEQRLMSNQHD